MGSTSLDMYECDIYVQPQSCKAMGLIPAPAG